MKYISSKIFIFNNINIIFIAIICFLCPLTSFSETSGHHKNKVCIINFDKSGEVNPSALKRIFRDKEGFLFYEGASPEDLRNCFLNGFEEIIIVSHAYNHYPSKDLAAAGSFGSNNKPESPKTRLIYWDPDTSKWISLKSKFFKEISKEINEKIPVNKRTLKSLRLLTCFSSNIVNQYKLQNFSKNMNITLDVAPSIIWSFMPYTWLVESLQTMEEDGNENYTFLIPISHFILGRYGERIVLGGRYKIKIKGISVGLGKIWLPINLAKEDLNSIPVGQTRSIFNFDVGSFSYAFIKGKASTYESDFMNEEIKWYNEYFPSLFEDLGFSLDVVSEVEVTRLR